MACVGLVAVAPRFELLSVLGFETSEMLPQNPVLRSGYFGQ
jgi:hypothetical protein